MNRFVCLDSWRGLCACMVMLFHTQVYSHAYDLPLIRNSYLFVDFFFVLSGFIISFNYQQRLLDGFSLIKFMMLRFGRVYPLHFFTLMAFVARELIQLIVPQLGAMGQTLPFQGQGSGLDTIVANIFLVHSLNVFPFLTWNSPSWSISVEFYTYLIFAAALLIFRNRLRLLFTAVLIICPIAILYLSSEKMDTTYDYGIIRSIYGFAMGAACFAIYQRYLSGNQATINRNRLTLVEILAVVSVVWFVSVAGRDNLSVAAPFVFAATVLIFSLQGGYLSTLLMARPFVFLGTLSYSIYMVHWLVLKALFDVSMLTEKLTGFQVFSDDGRPGTELWHGDILYSVLLISTISTSFITYKMIEQPGREWIRRCTQKL